MTEQKKITIKGYTGTQNVVTELYQQDANEMASNGYFPISQSWADGRWSGGDFVIALLLCLIVIGVFVFFYMLVVKPKGTLSVAYALRTATQ